MSSVKNLIVKPIAAADARAFIRKHHYSGKVDPRSQLHLGVFWEGHLEGVLQFGPSIDKSKTQRFVEGAGWNEFLELNRLAFSDALPKNAESRALAVSMRLLKKHAPHVKWIVSYADATQCGDGTIYRAAGFLLTQIKKNSSMYRMPDGEVIAKIVLEPGFSPNAKGGSVKARYGKTGSESSGVFLKNIGAEVLSGFQLRYIYLLDPSVRNRLTIPILPFSAIAESGASMYRGEKR